MKKTLKIVFRTFYNLDGFDQDGFNRKGFDNNRFNIKGINEKGYSRNKELACEEKLKQAIRENPKTYQYANLRFKQNVDLAISFLEQGGSFYLISKRLGEKKRL